MTGTTLVVMVAEGRLAGWLAREGGVVGRKDEMEMIRGVSVQVSK